MEFKNATMADFDVAFDYIEKLWTYNTYDKEVIRKVYADVLADENSFAFFLMDGDEYHGFCHGAYFNTFWLSGMTCYVSSIITNEDERGKGNGVKLMDHAKELAKETKPAPPAVDTIPTSQIRFNVCEEYREDFRPTIAYLQFLDMDRFRKITDYNWEPGMLTLAVYDEDANGYLVMAYDNGYVAKVPMNEILKFEDSKSYTRHSGPKLIFASIAHDDDALVSVT